MMKKRLFYALLALLCTALIPVEVLAQKGKDYRKLHLNVGPEVAFPLGDFNNSHNMAIGGSAQLAVPVGGRLYLLGHVGYNRYFGEGSNDALNIVPYRAGARLRLIGSTYVSALGGASTFSQNNFSNTVFSYAGGVGVANQRVDIGVRYEANEFDRNLQTLVVRLAYVIGLQVGSASR